ncbi:diguanylate cyclase domain-containing protein [Dactylosporangium sp. CA-139066]|uniref:diguanylate cyclase domain-containing protein n=1 Tax=Dactylosporangium sp. CA-139066 TaxID=3239930 RepID=UPI003D94A779
MRIQRLVPAGGAVAVLAAAIGPAVPRDGGRIVFVTANLVLIGLLTWVVHRTSRLSDLPRATARFWASLALALAVYGLGIAADLAAAVAQTMSGRPVPMLGSQLVYPVAGLLTMYAVFRYPTTARTRGDKITVALDTAVVLLGGASFIWYFVVGARWDTSHGWLELSELLALPSMLLVAGFGILKIAFVGVGVLARRPLICYALCVALSAAGTTMPDGGGPVPVVANAMLLLSQLCSLTGAVLQYTVNATATGGTAQRSGRRSFSVLPYGASAAAFVLLAVVVQPALDWRQWGVLVAVGLLLCFVTVRQLVALRENDRLLAENRALNVQLQRQAWYDELTGLANRALYAREIAAAVERHAADGTDTAVLLIDLDDFKLVNDTLGHDAGDALLREIAARLRRSVGPDDVVCRLGGDEFVVLVGHPTRAAAADLAERLVTALSTPADLPAGRVRVGASIGVAFVGDAPGAATEVLRRADVAMYRAKAAGKRGSDLTLWAPASSSEYV